MFTAKEEKSASKRPAPKIMRYQTDEHLNDQNRNDVPNGVPDVFLERRAAWALDTLASPNHPSQPSMKLIRELDFEVVLLKRAGSWEMFLR
jgi:hypothetical protein